MLESLELVWNFICSICVGAYGFVSSVCVGAWDVLLHVHVNYPRIEGLVVGITLAWLLSRKDKHPLLRAASSPLKLILDILDLAWDQVVEFLGDVWGTLVGWTKGSLAWCKSKVVGVWSWAVNGLKALRDKLRKKKD